MADQLSPAALAQPEPEGPTRRQLLQLAAEFWPEGCEPAQAVPFARAVLARWGRPAPQPIPVAERLPGPGDCTPQGWCWVLYRGFSTWTLEPPLGRDGQPTGWTHWLPAYAMPIPSESV